MKVQVTYATHSEASIEAGDAEDMGWIHPSTEARRSHRQGGKRLTERNIRMAPAGRFDWRVRDALRWLDRNTSAYYEAEEDRRMNVPARRALSLTVRAIPDGRDVIMTANGYAYDPERIEYALHISDCSEGTISRLRRLLESQGVRFFD
jgi:hypothetical protein